MANSDDIDIERLLQEELDALSLDEPGEETEPDDNHEYNFDFEEEEEKAQKNIQESREQLELAMKERLVAFENEIQQNMKRYEIDYDEIDELLKKPIGNTEDEIENNVARECGINRDELNRVSFHSSKERFDATISAM